MVSKEQQRVYDRAWYLKNKEKRLSYNRNWRRKQYSEYQEFKKTLKCSNCEESDECCLDFHHLDPSKKDLAVSRAATIWSTKRLHEEVAKCIILCSNCHRKLHKHGSGNK